MTVILTALGWKYNSTEDLREVKQGVLAPQRRFERPTCPLGGGCSIQLSYWGTRRDFSDLIEQCKVCWKLALERSSEEAVQDCLNERQSQSRQRCRCRYELQR